MYYATASKLVKNEDGVGATYKNFILEVDTKILAVAREEAKAWAKREGLVLDGVKVFKNKLKRNVEFSEEYYESMRGTN